MKEPVTEETSDENDEGNYVVDWHAGFDKIHAQYNLFIYCYRQP